MNALTSIRRRRAGVHRDPLNFWPAVADMMLAALVVVLLLAFGLSLVEYIRRWQIAIVQAQTLEITRQVQAIAAKLTEVAAERSRLQTKLDKKSEEQKVLEEAAARYREELAKAKTAQQYIALSEERIRDLEALLKQLREANANLVLQRKPPNITISAVDTFTFDQGKGNLSSEFEQYLLTTTLQQLMEIFKGYDVDVLEIIGHTDRQPATGHVSNLDKELVAVLEGRQDMAALQFGSNADLGLIRAVALRKFLENQFRNMSDERATKYGLSEQKRRALQALQIRTYSAAQAVPSARSSGAADEKADRRIEIRFTKLSDQRTLK